MTIEEAKKTLETAKPSIEGVYPTYMTQAVGVAIRSLEAWEKLKPDTEWNDWYGYSSYSDEQIKDAITEIEKGGSE